jgi:hypothetical protein
LSACDQAFALFMGTCSRGVYDNMKTAVETIFVGKDRRYNRRYLQVCCYYLVDPVACTTASGWEKGQVVAKLIKLRPMIGLNFERRTSLGRPLPSEGKGHATAIIHRSMFA